MPDGNFRCRNAGALSCFWMPSSSAVDRTVQKAPPGSLSWGFSAPTPAPENSYTPVPVLLHSAGWLCGQGSLWLGTQHGFNKEYWMWHLTHGLVSVLHFLGNYVQWWPIGKLSGYLFWMIHNCFPMHRKDWTTEPLKFHGVARNRAGR